MFFHINCLSQYAERKPATGREVLLDLNQAKPTRHELGPRPCREKCSTQYAEREPATGRAVSARLIARRIYQARIGTGTAGRAVLIDFRQAKTIRLEFAPGQARYAEREPATSRAGPMVLFDHRPARTNWPSALPTYMSKGSMPRTGWPFSDR